MSYYDWKAKVNISLSFFSRFLPAKHVLPNEIQFSNHIFILVGGSCIKFAVDNPACIIPFCNQNNKT